MDVVGIPQTEENVVVALDFHPEILKLRKGSLGFFMLIDLGSLLVLDVIGTFDVTRPSSSRSG